MSDIAEQKKLARKAGFVQRKLAHENAGSAGIQAAAHLMEWLNSQQFAIVSGYMPMRSEIDVLPIMRLLHMRGVQICVPVIMGKGQPLKFKQWTPASVMEDGPFGAKIPRDGAWLVPDLLLCPLVAFDASGHRLGYGGGFYDRSLAEIRAEKPATALGYAYAAQEMAAIPTESTDQALDGMVTEQGVRLLGQ